MESFLMLFYLLDRCYSELPENDLGAFLGMICPELWADRYPADKAIVDDWIRMIGGRELRGRALVDAAYSFLQEYEARFGFCFSGTGKILAQIADRALLDEAYAYAVQMRALQKAAEPITNATSAGGADAAP